MIPAQCPCVHASMTSCALNWNCWFSSRRIDWDLPIMGSSVFILFYCNPKFYLLDALLVTVRAKESRPFVGYLFSMSRQFVDGARKIKPRLVWWHAREEKYEKRISNIPHHWLLTIIFIPYMPSLNNDCIFSNIFKVRETEREREREFDSKFTFSLILLLSAPFNSKVNLQIWIWEFGFHPPCFPVAHFWIMI